MHDERRPKTPLMRRRSVWLFAMLAVAAAALAGCGTVGYLAQSASGHLQLMHAGRAYRRDGGPVEGVG